MDYQTHQTIAQMRERLRQAEEASTAAPEGEPAEEPAPDDMRARLAQAEATLAAPADRLTRNEIVNTWLDTPRRPESEQR